MATTPIKDKVAPKKKKDTKINSGILHVHTTDNNTVLALVDENGNKIL
jgi:ribosomal protein S11